MKINKVDDKPMMIHTKQKAKIHTVESKKAEIKGSNILATARESNVKSAKTGSGSFRKSTVHQVEKVRRGRIFRYRQNLEQAKKSIKTKNSSIKIAGVEGVNSALDQLEGGEEIKKASGIAYGTVKPVSNAASKGATLFRQKAIEAKKRKIKKVDAGKKVAKKGAKKAVKDTAKATTKVVATTTTTAVGTGLAPGVGTTIGIGAGYAAGVAIDYKNMKGTNRSRKLKFFLDKMNAQEKQKDSFTKLVKDLIVSRVSMAVKSVAPIIGIVFLALVLIIAAVAIPVIAVVAVVYNSPFAIFFPPLEDGDTVTTVASAYVAEFNREVSTLATEHTGYDDGVIVYVNYEGESGSPSNYYDILAVYMVKHGVGDTATIMNDTSKGWLQTVVNDMCSYTTSNGTETVTITNDDGSTTTTTKTVLHVNVTFKSYVDMISEYGFDAEQEEMIREFMSPEYLVLLGWNGGGGGGEPGVCSLTEAEIAAALSTIPNGLAKDACDYALHRVGYPYSQEYRDLGEYYDCSSLAYYSWKSAGIDISYGGATTAAAEGQGLEEKGKIVSYEEIQPGDLIFYSYCANGRYKNISHVAIYVGNGKVVEAKSEDYGVVYGDVPNTRSIVFIGRPGN